MKLQAGPRMISRLAFSTSPLNQVRIAVDDARLDLIPKPLIGREDATIDDKGRILVGKKKRDRLGEDFVMGLNDIGCLVAMSRQTFLEVWSEIRKVPWINQGRQNYAADLLGTFEDDLNFDKPGRVVIPKRLRDQAKIGSKVVLIGAGDYLQIWAEEELAIYEKDKSSYGAERREAMLSNYQKMQEGL